MIFPRSFSRRERSIVHLALAVIITLIFRVGLEAWAAPVFLGVGYLTSAMWWTWREQLRDPLGRYKPKALLPLAMGVGLSLLAMQGCGGGFHPLDWFHAKPPGPPPTSTFDYGVAALRGIMVLGFFGAAVLAIVRIGTKDAGYGPWALGCLVVGLGALVIALAIKPLLIAGGVVLGVWFLWMLVLQLPKIKRQFTETVTEVIPRLAQKAAAPTSDPNALKDALAQLSDKTATTVTKILNGSAPTPDPGPSP